MSYKVHRQTAAVWLQDRGGLGAELARDELADICRNQKTPRLLEKQIRERVQRDAPRLLAVPGCGPLSATKIVAETGGVHRFPSEAAFARFAGRRTVTGVVGFHPRTDALRQDRKRQVNAALHRIAMTQLRCDGTGREYYRKRIEAGEPPMPALRRLKRRLVRVVFTCMRADAAALVRSEL